MMEFQIFHVVPKYVDDVSFRPSHIHKKLSDFSTSQEKGKKNVIWRILFFSSFFFILFFIFGCLEHWNYFWMDVGMGWRWSEPLIYWNFFVWNFGLVLTRISTSFWLKYIWYIGIRDVKRCVPANVSLILKLCVATH